MTQTERKPDPMGAQSFDLAAIVDRYQTSLLRYVVNMSRSAADTAEDVVQEAFVRLHYQVQRRGERSIREVGPWLFRVAHNLAIDHGRRRSRRRRADEQMRNEMTIRDSGADPADQLSALAHREACRSALSELDRLPDPQKQVLLLKVVEGFSIRQIARITGRSSSGVAYRLDQALRTLTARLKQKDVI